MTQRLVILALLSILAASCSRGEAAPPSFDGSCAARIHSWADWQRAEHLQSFACLDAPTEGATSTSPTELRGWAGYPAHPEVAIQMQVADELGHRMLETAHRTIEGYGGSFRLVPFREVARLPADSAPGATIRILVILADPNSGEGFAYTEVSFKRQ